MLRRPYRPLSTGTSGLGAVVVAAALAGTAALGSATTAASAAVVSLRVDAAGAPAPLFDGPIDTDPHPVDGGDGSGPHPCAGPPGETPAPTPTGALDDAMRAAGVSWRGSWDPSFGDFFVERIGPYASAEPDRYWSLSVNGGLSAGGCLTTLDPGDSVLFFHGPLFGDPGAATPDSTGAGPGTPASGAPQADRAGQVRGQRPSARPPRALRRVARRAARFLRRADGFGREWAELALALRARRPPTRDGRDLARRLLGLRSRRTTRDDVDSLALRAWALAASDRSEAARRLALRVRSAQSTDGGFPALAGGASNAQSTGVALVALRVAGLGPRSAHTASGLTPLDYLASLARRNGSIAYARGRAPTPVWVTAQALLGLTAKGKLMRLGIRSRAKTKPKTAVTEETDGRAALGWRDHQGS